MTTKAATDDAPRETTRYRSTEIGRNVMLPTRPDLPASNTMLAPRQPPPPQVPPMSPPGDELPCADRAKRLGTINCGCSGAPTVYACDSQHVPNHVCIIHASPYRQRTINLDSGGTCTFTGRPGICSVCRHYHGTTAQGRSPDRTHPHRRKLRPEDLEWISTAQLVEDGMKLIRYVSPDTTGIIGVPRSGMIPATAIATHCHLPLYELTASGPRQLAAGSRGHRWPVSRGRPKFLLIDDSSHNGGAMKRARHALRNHDVTYAAVYTLTPRTVDVYARLLDQVHIFDWNIFNNGIMQGRAIDPRLRGEGFMLDFDGILCPDPTQRHTDADDAAVRAWLRDVRPMRWIPRLTHVPYVVSFRLEKHRSIIAAWLETWRIRVDHLVLHQADTFAERDAHFDAISHKAERFKASNCSLFFESGPIQSQQIATHSGKPVCCPPAGKFFFP